jgi:hypothetical protein
MNVLVSDTTNRYDSWLVVRGLKDVKDIVGNIDNLIYHKSMESSEDKIRYLTDLYKGRTACKIIYVRNRDEVDNAIRMLVVGGLNGKYVDDEFFLESERELNNLITDLSVVVDKKDLASSSVLNDFFNRYLSEGGSSIPKGYLSIVKKAAMDLIDSYHYKSLETLKMSESAAEIFSSSVELVAKMKEQQFNLEKDLRKLKESKNELDAFTVPPTGASSVSYYPKVSYMKNKDIIRVKDLGRNPLVISFMLGFREYLEKIKNVRPKMIVVEGNGKWIEDRYSDMKWVTNSNKNDVRNFYGDVVFTNCPTSLVMNRLLNDNDYDICIVIDRTVSYKDNILHCKGKEFFVVSGDSLISKFKLPRGKCISLIKEIVGTLLSIPLFDDYPERDDQRINRYLKDCATQYELLYNSKV